MAEAVEGCFGDKELSDVGCPAWRGGIVMQYVEGALEIAAGSS
jgi:hypothetical protein